MENKDAAVVVSVNQIYRYSARHVHTIECSISFSFYVLYYQDHKVDCNNVVSAANEGTTVLYIFKLVYEFMHDLLCR